MAKEKYNSKKILAAHERILASSVRALGHAAGQKLRTPEEESRGAIQRMRRALEPARISLDKLFDDLQAADSYKKVTLSQGNGVVIVSESPDKVELRIVVDLRHNHAGIVATNTPKNGGEPLEFLSGVRRKNGAKK